MSKSAGLFRSLTFSLGATIALASPIWAAAESLDSRPVVAKSIAKNDARVLAAPQAAPSLSVRLPALRADEKSRLAQANANEKYVVVGVGRSAPSLEKGIALRSLDWSVAADKTRHATIEITSSGAAAVRASLRARDLPKNMRAIVYGTSHPELIYGPYSSEDLRAAGNEPYWLPVIEGETLRIELQASGDAKFDDKLLTMPRISHLVTSIRTDSWFKDLSDVGSSGTCNIDIACPPSTATWVTRGQAVAKYFLTNSIGQTGACTGTLVNSSGAAPPNYFLTANHCINNVAAANSMHFYWFFQRAVCGGAAPTAPLSETVGGATLIKTVPANDHTLVRMNNAPPAGTSLAGWNAATLTNGVAVVGLHHPAGDLKKYSAGTHQGFTNYSDNTVNASASHIRVLWNAGTTEGGSSGSALFNAAGEVVGTLHGGLASCASQASPDWYGRFDQAFGTLQPWLMPGAGGPPPPDTPPAPVTVDLTSGAAVSGTVSEDEDKWYRIQTNAGDSLTVTLTGLTADADLYVFRNTQGGTYTCRSILFNTASETCTVSSAAASTWFIDVYGYEAANYTVTATVTGAAPPPAGGGGGDDGGGALSQTFLALLSALFLGRFALRRWMPARR